MSLAKIIRYKYSYNYFIAVKLSNNTDVVNSFETLLSNKVLKKATND